MSNAQLDLEIKKYAYELTQKLTYFIITIELVFCGYMLINSEKLTNLKYSEYLFLTVGVAALFGLLWRFTYNIGYDANAHHRPLTLEHRIANYLCAKLHNMFALLSTICLIWGLAAGFYYLKNNHTPIHTKQVNVQIPPNKEQIQKAPITNQLSYFDRNNVYPDLIKGIPAAFVALVASVIAALIGYHQYHVTKAKLNHDLFKQRYEIFEITWKFLSDIDAPDLSTRRLDFNNKIPQALFLFGKDIESYMNDISHKAIKAFMFQRKINSLHAHTLTQQEIDENHNLSIWFADQAIIHSREMFGRYLDFSKWSSK